MIVVDVKDSDSLDKALKKFKKKIERTKVIQSLRERKFFTKPSVVKRTQNLKAKHRQKMQGEA